MKRQTLDGLIMTDEISVTPVQQVGGDHMVVAAAKVSTSGADALRWADPAKAESRKGLIRYLMRSGHGTPFEHAEITLFVHAPKFVWWQWVRHRVGHSFNLESSRYKKLEPVFWMPTAGRPMVPAADHKPARPSFVAADDDLHRRTCGNLMEAYAEAWKRYEMILADGVGEEVARATLPFGVYFSGWVSVNPRSLMHFLSKRLTPFSREQSLALTNLEQSVMWANAAIARNE